MSVAYAIGDAVTILTGRNGGKPGVVAWIDRSLSTGRSVIHVAVLVTYPGAPGAIVRLPYDPDELTPRPVSVTTGE